MRTPPAQGKPYDFKSDVWALGVVLYSCATKRHPFDAQSQVGRRADSKWALPKHG